MLAWLHARVVRNPRTTALGAGVLCAGLGLIFGADAVKGWADDITAGGVLATVVMPLILMRDPRRPE